MKKIRLVVAVLLVFVLSVAVLAACRGKTGEAEFSYLLNEEKTEYSVRAKNLTYLNGIAPEILETYKRKPVTKIAPSAFRGAIAFVSITIPAFINEIGSDAFRNCDGLTVIMKSTTPPVQNESFGSDLLHRGLKAIIVPASAVDAYKEVWAEYSSLIYPDSSVTNDYYLLSPEGVLVSYFGGEGKVTIPASITKTGARAFYNNELIQEVVLHAGIENLEGYTGCKMITKFEVDANNAKYAAQDGIVYNKEKTSILLIPRSLGGAITLPAGVTQLSFEDKNYFAGTKITSVTLPAGYTRIVEGVFKNCAELTSVTLPQDLAYIGTGAFEGCSKLASLTIPASVTQIGTNAFVGCDKLTIRVPFAESEKPEGWAEGWDSGKTVVWGA